IHVDMVAEIIEHHNADLYALVGRRLLAHIGDALRGGQIDGGEILNLFGGFAADDELFRYALSKSQAARRNDGGNRQTHDTKSHSVLHLCLSASPSPGRKSITLSVPCGV